MRRWMILGGFALVFAVAALAVIMVFPDTALAQPRRAPARAGGPELLMVAGTLGTLGLSALGGGYLLRRKKDD